MDKIFIQTLFNLPRVGRRTVQKVLAFAGYEPSTVNDLYDLLTSSNIKFKELSLSLLQQCYGKALHTTDMCERADISILLPSDSDFPQSLKVIKDPPQILYAKGDFGCLTDRPCVAIIGSRHPTDFGRKSSLRISEIATQKGFTVVSGLALGCDTAAHMGCLNMNGKTAAVLPGGINKIYPRENHSLTKRILEGGGCILSEYAPDCSPEKNYFIDRDRLQSGLSLGVIVVETSADGGAMHTARFCLEQGKYLGCVFKKVRDEETHFFSGNDLLLSENSVFKIEGKKEVESFITLLKNSK